MERDILFKEENFIFSYRVAGLLLHNGKILLQKPKDDGYAIIGGHVKAFETGEEALLREYKEELGAKVSVERLFAVGEVFFPWGNKPAHQLGLYYLLRLEDDSIPKDGSWPSKRHWEEQKLDLDFCWVPVEELAGKEFYPEELLPYLKNPPETVIHFVSKQV